MMTRGVGNELKLLRRIQCTLSFFEPTLSNFGRLQREFSKTHVRVQIHRWGFRDTFYLQCCQPSILEFLSTPTLWSVCIERHRCQQDKRRWRSCISFCSIHPSGTEPLYISCIGASPAKPINGIDFSPA